jgi:sarcosine oxidase subunit gamma
MSKPTLQSPLHAFGLDAQAVAPSALNCVVFSELPHLGYIVLRGKADDSAFMRGVASVLGQNVPVQPRQVLQTAEGPVLWLSPDEWLLVCPRSRRDALLAALTAALKGLFAQVVDNSGGFTTLRLAGPEHLALLRQLGPYDFESQAIGTLASTVMSKTSVTVVRTDATGVLLVFRRSFADYLWRLIERTAKPYHPCIATPAAVADPVFTPLLTA